MTSVSRNSQINTSESSRKLAAALQPRPKPPQEAVHVALALQVGMVGVGPTTSGFLQGPLKLYNPESLLYGLSNKPAAPAVGDRLPQFVHERVRQHNLGLHRSPDVINTQVSLTIWPVKPDSSVDMMIKDKPD